MSGPIPLRDVATQFDPERHAVIEASAGTGKTWTMVEIALRLLREGRAALEQLLLVTFTEKAAGELRDRLRSRIEAALPEAAPDSEEERRLLDALDSFPSASISTIHAFCARVLEEQAFESQHAFATATADEGPIVEELLGEYERRYWAALDPEELALRIRSASFAQDAPGWESRILLAAAQYEPEAGDVLLPEASEARKDTDSAASEVDALRGCLEACRLPLGPPPREGDGHPLFLEMKQDKSNHQTVQSIVRRYIEPLSRLVHTAPSLDRTELLAETIDFLARAEPKPGGSGHEHGLDHIHARLKAPAPPLLVRLEAIAAQAKAMSATVRHVREIADRMAATTIAALQRGLERELHTRGVATFSSMIRDTHRAVRAHEGDNALVARLRERFRYAIVDEFQDTDRMQWDILATLFAEAPGARLFVVGDPKQSIYGFRGADVHAYEAACRRLIGERGAGHYALPVSWRAVPPLVEATDALFAGGGWFEEEARASISPAVWAAEVEPAPEGATKLRAVSGYEGRPPVTLVRLTEARGADRARRSFARFVREEILRLIGRGGAPLRVADASGERGLSHGDFCILVERRSEMACHAEELRAAGIPYSIYKERGLWQTEEATHLHYLLAALANPGERAARGAGLITRFLGVAPEQVAAYTGASETHPLSRLLTRWSRYAERRQWPRLFASLLEEGPVLIQDLDRAPDAWERRATNYRHLAHALEREATEASLDLAGLVRALAERRAGVSAAEDAEGLQRIETDADTVRLMTIHAAKGLEFPVVFLATGFSAREDSRIRRWDADADRWVIDIAGALPADDEPARERRRLYYVAITRAALRAYAPLHAPTKGDGGALATLLEPAAKRAWGEEHLPETTWADEGRRIAQAPPSRSLAERSGEGARPGDARVLPPILTSAEVRRVRRVESFSSLHARHTAPTWGEEALRDDDDRGDGEPLRDAVPGGVETGQLFHSLLERLLRSSDLDADLADGALDEALRGLANHHLPGVAREPSRLAAFLHAAKRMVRRSLGVSLPGLDVPLAALVPRDVLPEVSFLLPLTFEPARALDADRLRLDGPLLTGVIDLVARHAGRWYLLDWKSNRLDSYAPESVAADMRANEYDLQWRLYALALDRWLAFRLGHAYDPARDLGGVCYVYLRGLDPERPEDGLAWAPLGPDELEVCARIARERLGEGAVSDG